MKKYLVTLAIAAIATASCAKGPETPKVEAAQPKAAEQIKPATAPKGDIQEASIAVLTVKCGMCAKTVTKAVKELDGVSDVTVDRKTHVAKIKYVASKTNVTAIEKQIAGAGYTANKTERDAKAYEALSDCCK